MEDILRKRELPTARVERTISLVVLLSVALLLACLKFRVALIPVLAVVGTALVAALVLFPTSAACMLIFFAYGQVSSAFVPGAFSALLAASLIALTVRALLGSRPGLSVTRVDVAILVYVCAAGLSMLFSVTPEAGGPVLLLAAKWLMFYALLVNIVDTERSALWATRSMLAGASLSGVNALWHFSHGRMSVVVGALFRAAGLAGDPNELALVMVTAIPISAYMIGAVRDKRWQALLVALTLVMVGANLVTLSRTGLVAMILVLLLVAFRERRRRWVRVSVFVLILILPALMPGDFWRRINSAFIAGDYSAYLRSNAMAAGLRMFAENPITGVGLGSYITKSTQYGDLLFPLVAHNMYLHVLAETGILGFAAMAFVVVSSLRNMVLAERTAEKGSPVFYLARGYQVGYAAFLVSGLLLSIHFNQSFWYMSAASVFLLRAARRSAFENPRNASESAG